MTNAIYEFTSHVSGKNAKVSVYSDRLEWAKTNSVLGRATAAKVKGAIMQALMAI